MRVILPTAACCPWLAGEEIPLEAYPQAEMTLHPVSTLGNRIANDEPRYVEPVA